MALDCRNELVHRERRGMLSSAEELALEAHLENCEACRMTRDIGADFDAEGELRVDDGALIERLARRAAATQKTPRPRRLRTALLIAAAFTLLFGAAASAKSLGWFGASKAPPNDLTPSAPAKTAEAPAQAARSAPPASAGAIIAANTSESAPRALAPAPSIVATPPPHAAKALPAASVSSAAQIFRKANEARRGGDAALAIKLYRDLQREHPTSAEASQSAVSLGHLLLGQGSSSPALEQFNRYLAAAPAGALSAEALYGKGRALQALGRVDAEKQIWRELLARFPTSPYRDRAKRRLTELP